MMNASASVRRGLAYGVIGGVIAGLVMSGLGYLLPIPRMDGVPFFINAVVMWNYFGHWGLNGVSVAIMGWALHIITSSVVGGLFGVLIARFAFFKVRSLNRGGKVVPDVSESCPAILAVIRASEAGVGYLTHLRRESRFPHLTGRRTREKRNLPVSRVLRV